MAVATWLLFLLLFIPHIAPAATCSDTAAATSVRHTIEASCAGATDRRSFLACANARLSTDGGALEPACRRLAKGCLAKSTFGVPGAVTCCVEGRRKTRCKIAKSREACVAKGGCAGSFASCCDACGASGCVATTTSTTSTSTTSAQPTSSSTTTSLVTTTSSAATTSTTAPLGCAGLIAGIRPQVEAECLATGRRARALRCARKTIRRLGRSLDASCRKELRRRHLVGCLKRSTYGRPSAVACCLPRGARSVCKIVRSAARCTAKRGCVSSFPSCCDACTATGCAAPVTTTTTSTSTTTTNSTLCALSPTRPACFLEFTTERKTATCGATATAGGAHIADLACGALAIGGGISTVPPGVTPDGTTYRFALTGCTDETYRSCALGPASDSGPTFDCTTTGCFFGPPLPIPNGLLSTCVVNRWSGPGSGTVDVTTAQGTLHVPLTTHTFLTGNAAQPCPRCSATGTPGNPGTGTCDRGASRSASCTTTNGNGLSKDCLPGGDDGSSELTGFAVNLDPLGTGTARTCTADGVFCAGQLFPGCFGAGAPPVCACIEEDGAAGGGPLLPLGTSRALTFAAVFCIPMTGDSLIDGSASLPGPGAVSLPASVTLVGPP